VKKKLCVTYTCIKHNKMFSRRTVDTLPSPYFTYSVTVVY